jgi:hypothetical protein
MRDESRQSERQAAERLIKFLAALHLIMDTDIFAEGTAASCGIQSKRSPHSIPAQQLIPVSSSGFPVLSLHYFVLHFIPV